ncbi:MAG: DUF2786 domain-containing protein [Propionibacteriaceae bacterium]|nr:DUF2786 domain-containing protein [Propionibacteriaceae bacterium]
MSRRSQEKRAARAKVRAKQRARDTVGDGQDTRGPGAETYTFDWPEPQPLPARMTTADVLAWARAGTVYGIWRTSAEEIDSAVFQANAEPVLLSWVRDLYGRGGWQPTELIRHLSRHGKSHVADLTRVVVAVERDVRVGPTAKDAGWLRQWEAARLPSKVAETGWMAAWAASHPDWLKLVYRFAMLLSGMPALEPLLVPPSGVRSSRRLASKQAPASTNPMLERVRALLAKAESTQYESEAIAFTAKAQELMTKHALDQAMLAGAGSGPAAPGVIRIPIDPPYLDAKALLLQVIAEHSRCQAVLHESVEMSSVIGFSTDLEVVELLFTSLLVQAHHALAAASVAAPPGSRTRSQSFRAAFLQGFISRIDARLAAVNSVAFDEAKAHSDTFLPVLRSRDEQISEFMEQRFSARSSSRVRGGFDALGYHHGQRAGDAAALLSGAIEA